MTAYEKTKQEGVELGQKLTNLFKFMDTPEYNNLEPIHQQLLSLQASVMQQYIGILNLRLCLWNKDTDNAKSGIIKPKIQL